MQEKIYDGKNGLTYTLVGIIIYQTLLLKKCDYWLLGNVTEINNQKKAVEKGVITVDEATQLLIWGLVLLFLPASFFQQCHSGTY